MPHYAQPRTLDDALALLSQRPWRVLAGGTDFYPAQGTRPLTEDVLDIGALPELRGIRETDTHVEIGAATTWTDIIRASLPPAFDALKQAAREVGSVQIQNAGTVAGNLCNASPAADGVPPLLVLDAEVELRRAGAVRNLPLNAFILGNRHTALEAGEMMTALRVPKSSCGGSSAFLKLGARRYLVISIAMVAARIELESDGRVARAAVSVGACSVAAARLSGLEAALLGSEAADIARIVADAALPELSPIDDVRGSAGYRLHAARELVIRTLQAAIEAPGLGQRAA